MIPIDIKFEKDGQPFFAPGDADILARGAAVLMRQLGIDNMTGATGITLDVRPDTDLTRGSKINRSPAQRANQEPIHTYVNGYMPLGASIKTLAHELWHVRQELVGDMAMTDDQAVMWKGDRWDEKRFKGAGIGVQITVDGDVSDNSHQLPWEVESYEKAPALFEQMLTEMSPEDVARIKATEHETEAQQKLWLSESFEVLRLLLVREVLLNEVELGLLVDRGLVRGLEGLEGLDRGPDAGQRLESVDFQTDVIVRHLNRLGCDGLGRPQEVRNYGLSSHDEWSPYLGSEGIPPTF